LNNYWTNWAKKINTLIAKEEYSEQEKELMMLRLMQFFGYNRFSQDSYLENDIRKTLYALEETNLFSSGSLEVETGKKYNWVIFFWFYSG